MAALYGELKAQLEQINASQATLEAQFTEQREERDQLVTDLEAMTEQCQALLDERNEIAANAHVESAHVRREGRGVRHCEAAALREQHAW